MTTTTKATAATTTTMCARKHLLLAAVVCAAVLALAMVRKEQRGMAARAGRLSGKIPFSTAAGGGGGFRGFGAAGADPPPPPRRWPETDEGRACSALHARLGASGAGEGGAAVAAAAGPGPSAAWGALAGRILNASYYPAEHADHPDLGPAFRGWVDTVFAFYAPSRLRRSAAHPAPVGAARRLLGLVGRWSAAADSASDPPAAGGEKGQPPPEPEPIRILVLGGSVTYGHRSGETSEVPGLPEVSPANGAWPARLERMLNLALFSPAPLSSGPFRVANLAIRGTNSEVGAAVLETRLVVDQEEGAPPPHVIISSFSTNDVLDPDAASSSHRHQEALARAALGLRPCDDDLPLLVLADDFHGMRSNLDDEVTGKLYKVASWYDAMMVAYANVVKRSVLARYERANVSDPLFGSNFEDIHLGTGFHLGMAWTVLFNLLGAFVDACEEVAGSSGTAGDAGAAPARAAPAPATMGAATASSKFAEPPAKFLPRMADAEVAAPKWRERLRHKDEECRGAPPPRPPYSTEACPYGWVENRATTSTAQAVADALRPVLAREPSGWAVLEGFKAGSPTFAANSTGATFELAIHNATGPIRHLTIFYMRSYGRRFANSKVELTVRVERLQPPLRVEPQSALPQLPPHAADADVETYEVSGSHTHRTSTIFPIKFQLPGGGAREGDTVRLEARLVSGKTFAISGMAFCR